MPKIVSKSNTEEIPSLQVLAAKKIKETNPNLFFKLPPQFLNSPEFFCSGEVAAIVRQFLNSKLQGKINEETQKYEEKMKARKENIDDCEDAFRREPYAKFSGCMTSMLLTGLHVGLYFILKNTAELSNEAEVGWLVSIPASMLVGACLGICCAPKIGRSLGHCLYPSASNNITIEMEELGGASNVPS
ncbi:hypothetical protein E3983_06135 [Legionella israelensis]|uniref:Uncharacterized protein n=1 Tax=Legionella israelensis TaxID=454 RepID=A0AAX1EGM3_9GAMM|nr:hypothetical protein [Legionella israelensis]QBR83964.1 hypothetical protein E3983_06135 [Legionella israelensis]